ncbi:MAG TPA: hypothetical protein VJA21_15665, partial [Verrucomicrobiae bacterium]
LDSTRRKSSRQKTLYQPLRNDLDDSGLPTPKESRFQAHGDLCGIPPVLGKAKIVRPVQR